MEQRVQSLQLKDLEVSQSSQLTLEKAKKLFVLSFRFSQGGSDLQMDIFAYLHRVHPEWRLSKEFKEQLSAAVKIPIYHPKLDVFSDVDEAIEYQTIEMQSCFDNIDQEEGPILLKRIAYGIAEKDFSYLCDIGNGRPRNSSAQSKKHPALDPFLSHICYYAL